VFGDLTFAIAPQIFLRKVQLSSRDRMAVRILLGLIIIATVMSICKLITLPVIFRTHDLTYDAVPEEVFAM